MWGAPHAVAGPAAERARWFVGRSRFARMPVARLVRRGRRRRPDVSHRPVDRVVAAHRRDRGQRRMASGAGDQAPGQRRHRKRAGGGALLGGLSGDAVVRRRRRVRRSRGDRTADGGQRIRRRMGSGARGHDILRGWRRPALGRLPGRRHVCGGRLRGRRLGELARRWWRASPGGVWGRGLGIGLPSKADLQGGNQLSSVACPSAGSCVAVGRVRRRSANFNPLDQPRDRGERVRRCVGSGTRGRAALGVRKPAGDRGPAELRCVPRGGVVRSGRALRRHEFLGRRSDDGERDRRGMAMRRPGSLCRPAVPADRTPDWHRSPVPPRAHASRSASSTRAAGGRSRWG